MPSYDFQCLNTKCGKTFEASMKIAELPNTRCIVCGAPVKQLFRGHSVITFKPRWYEHITSKPLYIESKKQLKRACEEHDCYSAYLLDN